MNPTAVTNIPIEVLFSIIGALGAAVYAHLIYEIRTSRKDLHALRTDSTAEWTKRRTAIKGIETVLMILANKAGIPWKGSDNNGE